MTTLPRTRFLLFPGSRLSGVGGVGWRLVAANNRELGRTARTCPDVGAALAAIDAVRDVVVSASAYVERAPGRGRWSWRLVEGATTLVTSGHSFRHEWEARRNLEQFCREAPSAPVAPRVPEAAVPARARARPGARD